MRKQTFDRIKKTLAILLAVFFVVTTMAASASACTSKAANANLPNKVVSNLRNNAVDANGLTEAQKTALGNQLLDMFDNNGYNNGWDGYNNGWDGYNNGLGGYNNGWDGYNNGWNGYNNGW
jgi:hypothetical protein